MNWGALTATLADVTTPLIYREEVVALLFNVSDIVALLARITDLPGDDDGEEEDDEG